MTGEGLLEHRFDAVLVFLDGRRGVGPAFGFADDEGIVHQGQGLGGDVGDGASGDCGEGAGHVEGEHHGWEEVAPDAGVNRAAAGSIERTGSGAAPSLHKAGNVD